MYFTIFLIFSRWQLQITDFGLLELRATDDEESRSWESNALRRHMEKLFWRAPELLRDETSARGTQKGDVYSFAIIVYEMFRRSEHGSPYEDILPVGQIIDLIKNPHGNDFKRPDMKALLDPSLPVEVPPYIKGIIFVYNKKEICLEIFHYCHFLKLYKYLHCFKIINSV